MEFFDHTYLLKKLLLVAKKKEEKISAKIKIRDAPIQEKRSRCRYQQIPTDSLLILVLLTQDSITCKAVFNLPYVTRLKKTKANFVSL